MKHGKSLVDLAAELERLAGAKEDFLVDTRELQFSHEEGQSFDLVVPGTSGSLVTDHAHGQIGAFTDIPARYYRRLREEAPELLVENVRHWFDEKPARRMVRTLDGNARAFLSDRYRRIDNEQIFYAAGEALVESGAQVEVISSEVTERKLYIQAKFPRLEQEVNLNDPVQGGLIITNSEIGVGALEVRPLIYRLVCTNGMIRPFDADDGRLRRQHVGRRVEAGEDYSIYSEETLKADDRALMLKIRDSIKSLSDPELFLRLVEQLKAANSGVQVQNPIKAVEVLGSTFALQSEERDRVLENLIRDGDYSRYGVLNAVTRVANDTESYDRAVELEETGGRILTLDGTAWAKIAEAA